MLERWIPLLTDYIHAHASVEHPLNPGLAGIHFLLLREGVGHGLQQQEGLGVVAVADRNKRRRGLL